MTTIEQLLSAYQRALDEGTAALFAGAGLSRPSGFVDWKGLLRDIATDLHLDVDQENDLVALAQYHVNERRGRGGLNQVLIDEFTRTATPTRNHELIASLPIPTLWTTNYDKLIEDAARTAHKRLDVKIRPVDFQTTLPKRDATLYKMHGDITAPDEAVLTKEDYESYDEKRRIFSMQLQGDLISKTFLFLGFSFTDPNIDYILGRIRGLMGTNRREHYCVMRQLDKPKSKGAKLAQYEYEKTKQTLRIADLQRYGIRAVLVDDYSRITQLLEELSRRVHRKNIFVSGSAADYDPLGQPRLEGLARRLGHEIIRRGFNLTSGLGVGVGGLVLLGALDELYRQQVSHLDERMTLRPFPQDPPTTMPRKQLWTRYRTEMISTSGVAIFLAGNKNPGGTTVIADGCLEEFDIAAAQGKVPIPIGVSGHAALEIWNRVNADRTKYYGKKAAKIAKPFAALNDPKVSDDKLVEAVFEIVAAVT